MVTVIETGTITHNEITQPMIQFRLHEVLILLAGGVC